MKLGSSLHFHRHTTLKYSIKINWVLIEEVLFNEFVTKYKTQ